MIAEAVAKKKRDKKRIMVSERPGSESYRKTREDLSTMDKLHMALTGKICQNISILIPNFITLSKNYKITRLHTYII